MAKSEQLRANKNQHVVKNALSKGDDKKVVEAMAKVIAYLDKRLGLKNLGYKLNYVDRIKLRDLIDIIKSYEKRFEFAPLTKEESFIKPDGGILILEKVGDDKFKRVVLCCEMKRQGTNDKRAEEGKGKQAQGNAIERLGKNLIGVRPPLRPDILPGGHGARPSAGRGNSRRIKYSGIGFFPVICFMKK